MKKIITFLFCILSLNSISQTTPRMILVEEFTNASCSPCALSNPAFETLMNANTTKVIPIKYHTSFPGYDPFYSSNPSQNQARSIYYSVTAVPTARMDGAGTFLQDVNQTSINTESAISSNMSITLSWKYSSDGDSIYVTAIFKALQPVSGSMVGHIAVIEKSVHYSSSPGSNGEVDFTNVMRKMLPTEAGSPLPASMAANQTVTITTGMLITAGFIDISKIGVIGFIQNNSTKNILQATFQSAPTLVPLNPVILLSSKTNPVCTNNGSINISVIGASGVYNYQWSNGATTQDISGLATGTFSVTVTSGTKVSYASYILTQGTLSNPTSVITTAITSCSAILNWATLSGATNYQVKYKTAASTIWSVPITVTGNNYTFTGLTASTQYNFSVAGACANGSIGSATNYTATTSSCTMPTNIASSSVTSISAVISWSAGCNPTYYEIQYQIQGAASWSVVTTTNTSKTLINLTPSKIYSYKIRTLCGTATYTNFSTVKSFVTPSAKIEEFIVNNTVNFFPNPFESVINISISNGLDLNQKVSISAFDVLGRKCFYYEITSITDGNASIQIPSDLKPGTYFIELKSGEFIIQKPMIKM